MIPTELTLRLTDANRRWRLRLDVRRLRALITSAASIANSPAGWPAQLRRQLRQCDTLAEASLPHLPATPTSGVPHQIDLDP